MQFNEMTGLEHLPISARFHCVCCTVSALGWLFFTDATSGVLTVKKLTERLFEGN